MNTTPYRDPPPLLQVGEEERDRWRPHQLSAFQPFEGLLGEPVVGDQGSVRDAFEDVSNVHILRF